MPFKIKWLRNNISGFYFLSPRLDKEIYWEHDGMMDDPVYAKNAIKKIEAYERNGIFQGRG